MEYKLDTAKTLETVSEIMDTLFYKQCCNCFRRLCDSKCPYSLLYHFLDDLEFDLAIEQEKGSK